MPPPVFTADVIQGALYALFFQRVSPRIAHQKLLKMTGEEKMTVEQVEKCFEEFAREEPEEVEEPVQKLEPTLETILQILGPKVVAQHMDVRSRLVFRKTNKTNRVLMDNSQHYINQLSLQLQENVFLEISTDDGFSVMNQFVDEGFVRDHNDVMKLVQTQSRQESFQILVADLKTIFVNPKLVIGTLRLEDCSQNRRTVARYAWSAIDKLLQVETLDFNSLKNPRDLKKIIGFMDPSTLRALKVAHPEDRLSNSPEFDKLDFVFKDGLYETPQWKALKKLKIDRVQEYMNVICDHWSHLDYLNIGMSIKGMGHGRRYENMHDEVIELRDKLLENPNLNQYKIRLYPMPRAFEEEIMRTIRTHNTRLMDPKYAYFEYPNHPGKYLYMRVEDSIIWFQGPKFVEDVEEEVYY
ncbi:hypothetical protein CRE_22923 [Caenorhabditis remanei]|uniref:DUF38 domain-containing protein n=1 Tax=Caenorhabditis remanei TaxID=31234 RepID=E3MW52_CAERE|nr:hypothetical protein CRE_22923 [Caenorhabditis remanei]